MVIGTPVDEHLNPDPHAVPRALARLPPHLRDGQLLVLRSTVYPGVTRRGRADLRRAPARRRRGLLPRADRRGQGDGGAVRRCRRSSRAARPSAASARRQLFRNLTDTHRRARARGGGAGQAVHQHLALHQVRRGQPVLHDRQRPRPRLRPDPHGADARLPARRRPARRRLRGRVRACSRTPCSWRRSPTTRSRSATRRCWSTRACPLYLVSRLEERLDLAGHDASASWAWRSRARATTSARACPTSSSGSSSSRPSEVLCTDPYVTVDPSWCRSRRCWPTPTCSRRRPARRVPRPRDRPPVVDVWNLLGHGTLV